MDKKTKTALQSLLKSLLDLSISRPFREPVDTHLYPDYLLVVASPIDLKTIRKKVNEGGYEQFEEVQRDVRLMFANCKLYTPDPQAGIRVQCEELEKRFDAKWSAFEAKQKTDIKQEPIAAPVPKKRKRDNNKLSKPPEIQHQDDLKPIIKSEITYEEELNLDEGKAQPVFETVIKFAVPIAVEQKVVVVVPVEQPVKQEVLQGPLLPSCEAYIKAVLSPIQSLGEMQEWMGRIGEVLRRYGYAEIR